MIAYNEEFETLKTNLQNPDTKLILVNGEEGLGKTYTIQQALKSLSMKYVDLIFEREEIRPMETLKEFLDQKVDNLKEDFLMKATSLLNDHCIYIQNYEYADVDSKEVIKQLIKFHLDNKKECKFIIECSVEENLLLCVKNAFPYISFTALSNVCLLEVLKQTFDVKKLEQDNVEKILNIADGNIRRLFTTIQLLKIKSQLEIKDHELIFLHTDSNYNDLQNLYDEVFSCLKKKDKELLIMFAALGKKIYPQVVGRLSEEDQINSTLIKLSKKQLFIMQANENSNDSLFKNYQFQDDDAYEAVRLQDNNIRETEARCCNYFMNDYRKAVLTDHEKIILLYYIMKLNKAKWSLPQIECFIDLMRLSMKIHAYFNVIELAESYITNACATEKMINTNYHEFYLLYFKALYNVGCYHKIANKKDKFEDQDLLLYFAIALYNTGEPSKAKSLLNKVTSEKYIGYKYALLSSIYDWLGNNKKSLVYFKKADRYSNDAELKRQLRKRESMFCDVTIPAYKSSLDKVIDYYRKHNLKQCCECLYNYGAASITAMNFDVGLAYLNDAYHIMQQICCQEIYYVSNMKGIERALRKDFRAAQVNFLEALKYEITIDFCKLAVMNNLAAAYLCGDDIENCIELQKKITKILQEYANGNDFVNMKKSRPDIQHVTKQYFVNAALLAKKQGNTELTIEMLEKAKAASHYNSSIDYSIEQNLALLKKYRHKLKNPFKKNQGTKLERYFFENDLYVCEMMFWG